MVKKFFYLVLVILAGWLGYLGYQKLFPNEEKRLRLLLADLAEAASFSGSEKPLTRLSNAANVANFFSANAEINVQVPGEGSGSIKGRDEILRLAGVYRSTLNAVHVEFFDINVALDAEQQSAAAELTAKVTQSGQQDFGVQELKILLKKIDGDWRITHVDTVRTLGP